jgi:hypothetical protein
VFHCDVIAKFRWNYKICMEPVQSRGTGVVFERYHRERYQPIA